MKKKKCKKSVFYRFWHWYIKGEYHCDKCPYGWEERTSYEYDEGDGGCYVKGDICDTCRLFPPFRWLIGYPRKKKAKYYKNHQYDDMVEWYIAERAKEEKLRELIEMHIFGGCELCWKNENGEYRPIYGNRYGEIWRVLQGIEDFIREEDVKRNPPQNPWKKAIVWTWRKFTHFFKPYFCK